MKILHINTMDEGGAAIACIRIHLGLLERGIDSKILLLNKKRNIKNTYKFKVDKLTFLDKVINKIGKIFVHKNNKFDISTFDGVEMLSFPNSKHNILNHPLYKEADIIQLNWVSTFLDEPSFFANNTKPIVWRMPDLYACGGGYHYEVGFPFKKLEKVLNKNYSIRKKALKNVDITFVPISKWVKGKANESKLLERFEKTMIHNGVNFNVFKKLNKIESRKIFNLPQEKKIILIGADRLNTKRKGLELALDALDKIDLKETVIVIFGNSSCKLPKEIISVGSVTDERLLPVLYSASDYFLMSSIEEAFGQVTIEALACGVPVISFPNGGSLDIIRPNENGVLARDFTVESLAQAINEALNMEFSDDIIIEDIRERFNIVDKVNDYIDLYKSLLKY
ncbi:glycosyltransferase [Lutibacter sp.]|uniref:glycosyltransferase n=1 Tax=Lutibacter sp. TaxID=1925666 RepID=UPI0025BEFC02|nr:glycosyltransferase [Lutibacter sp.]MCF6182627.1 glycosyltransferase [Lutibacter sp.]